MLSQLVGWLNGLIAVRADPRRADGPRATKPVLVHAKILAGDNIRTDLGVLVEEQWPQIVDLMIRHGVEPDDAVENAGSLLYSPNQWIIGKLHGSIDASAPIERFDPNLAAHLLMAGLNKGIRPTITQQHQGELQTKYNLLDAHRGLRDMHLGRTLVIAIVSLINRSNLYQAAFSKRIARLHIDLISASGDWRAQGCGCVELGCMRLSACCKSCISGAQSFVEQ